MVSAITKMERTGLCAGVYGRAGASGKQRELYGAAEFGHRVGWQGCRIRPHADIARSIDETRERRRRSATDAISEFPY